VTPGSANIRLCHAVTKVPILEENAIHLAHAALIETNPPIAAK